MAIGSRPPIDDSRLEYDKDGNFRAAVGPDAVQLFRACALWSGMKLYAKTGILPNRGWKPTAMLKAASEYTGQTYRRGQHNKAAEDLKIWIDAMKAALPHVER